jgi:acetyl esterase/lipase
LRIRDRENELAVVTQTTMVTDVQAQTPFNRANANELDGPPGTLIRQEHMSGAPLDATAYRVLYKSTGLNEEPIAVSGVVIIPAGPAPPSWIPSAQHAICAQDEAQKRFAVWGHSQGGQAVLYAAVIAKSYAPELELAGVAAAAPATDLGALMRADIATAGGKNLLAMTLWSYSVFNAPMRDVIFVDVAPTVDKLANVCLEGIFDIEPRKAVGKLLQKRFLRVDDLTSIEPWRALLAQNTVGLTPPSTPVFIAQGMMDDTVVPSVTLAYQKRLCANGSLVSLMRLPDVGHGTVAMKSARDAVAWISDRFAGLPAPSDCNKQ